jgi:hypothetical protein
MSNTKLELFGNVIDRQEPLQRVASTGFDPTATLVPAAGMFSVDGRTDIAGQRQ